MQNPSVTVQKTTHRVVFFTASNPYFILRQKRRLPNLLVRESSFLRVIYEKDTKLKADELGQKRMTFCRGGFNFNDRIVKLHAVLRIYV